MVVDFSPRGRNGKRPKLLFIEPQQPPTRAAVVDAITRKMCVAFRRSCTSEYAYGGIHKCRCGALSSNVDCVLPDCSVTNSLCVHYVAHHRAEVPLEQLRAIEAFACGGAEPEPDELRGPQDSMDDWRRTIDTSLGVVALRVFESWGLDPQGLAQQMDSYDEEGRECARDFFSLLGQVKPHLAALTTALARLGLDPKAWGARSLRLSRWDRLAWADPLVEMLRSSGASGSDANSIAWLFPYVSGEGHPVPEALQHLSETATGDLKSAAEVAIEQFKNW